jgi:hypothetical protein
MKHLITILTLVFLFQSAYSQKIGGSGGKAFLERQKSILERQKSKTYKNFSFNDEETLIIQKCNTAKDVDYLTADEKEMIILHNLARVYPNFLPKYVANQYDTSFSNKLPKYNIIAELSILYPMHGLFKSAKMHAIKSGKNGTTGHQDVNERISKHNRKLEISGENCSYYDDYVINHFLGLMNSKPHFSNIIDKSYNSIGLSKQPHIKFGTNFVMCFGKNEKRDF